jgi:hypothetical protein
VRLLRICFLYVKLKGGDHYALYEDFRIINCALMQVTANEIRLLYVIPRVGCVHASMFESRTGVLITQVC